MTTRVIYRWRVERGREADFESAWAAITVQFRATRPGALGSLLLRSEADPNQFLAIARWRSRADWEAAQAQQEPPFDAAAAKVLREVAGAVLSMEFYDEVADLTQGAGEDESETAI